ncbi:hypothetical protein AB0L83_32025 [Streptomyces sp. NPDC052071]
MTVQVAIGGATGTNLAAECREIRLSPLTALVYDATIGKKFECGD